MTAPLLEVEGLKKYFPVRRTILGRVTQEIRAVDGVSFTIAAGETLGLVGESGCGKSTVGKLALRLIPPSAGRIRLEGEPIEALRPRAMRAYRRRLQIVFQDPFASLNPRLRVGAIVAEPLLNYGARKGAALEAEVAGLLAKVGLEEGAMRRFPHEFSGGQRQRIGIARALALKPRLIVCDEPVSALDVSVQAQVVNLLRDLQREFGLSYLFIAHDLAVVEHMSHRVAVMYLGRIVEQASRQSLFASPRHPYTKALLSAVPRIDGDDARRTRIRLLGEVPSALNPPSGCHFHPRCPWAEARCRSEDPRLREISPGHHVACHLAEDQSLAATASTSTSQPGAASA
ncbi:MAG TPA: dipeptide ABC transporter ATP-binding protein [Stellaceae bacterium]|nr:dipeptide ABC transporter ATP-binding protein [Stellaceae bacterium]